MFGLGFSEIVVLAVLGLILLGPEQLPDIARTLGRFINDLKRSTQDLTDEFKKQGFSDTDTRKLLEDIRRDVGDVAHGHQSEIIDSSESHRDPQQEKPDGVVASSNEDSAREKEEHGKKPESN